MSIRLQLLLVTAITAVLLAIQVTISFLNAVDARKSAIETIEAQAIQDLSLGITTGFAVDRGQTNGMPAVCNWRRKRWTSWTACARPISPISIDCWPKPAARTPGR